MIINHDKKIQANLLFLINNILQEFSILSLPAIYSPRFHITCLTTFDFIVIGRVGYALDGVYRSYLQIVIVFTICISWIDVNAVRTSLFIRRLAQDTDYIVSKNICYIQLFF